MKRLFYIVIIITLPIILFFQVWNYWKFNPPTDYSYAISQEIDPNYHDPELVKRYYVTAKEVGNYARYIWKEHRVDVTFADMTDPKEKEFGQIYNSMIASAQFLEGKLKQSKVWKGEKMTNEEIRILEQGQPKLVQTQAPSSPLQKNQSGEPIIAQIGDKNTLVREIQLGLLEKKYPITVDGIFKEETKQAIIQFQQKKKLPETGIVDIDTFLKLMK